MYLFLYLVLYLLLRTHKVHLRAQGSPQPDMLANQTKLLPPIHEDDDVNKPGGSKQSRADRMPLNKNRWPQNLL